MKLKRFVSCALAVVLGAVAVTGCADSGKIVKYEKYELLPSEGFGEIVVENTNGDKDVVSLAQLTESDIQQMNDGKARFVYSDEGYVTFLNGKFYEKKVDDYEAAVASIQGVAGLIGLGAGSEFFATHATKDAKGYTYYTFQQKYGDLTVQHATLRVVVGPDGYTAGLSSSFTPNLGIPEKTTEIGEAAAEQMVAELVEENFGSSANILSEYTKKVAITLPGGMTYSAYVIYLDNPLFAESGFENAFGLKYMEYFITLDGQYIARQEVASVDTDSANLYNNESYFENIKTQDVTYTLTTWDGKQKEVTVPVSYSEELGKYLLMDPERKIAVGDYNTFFKGGLGFKGVDNPYDFKEYYVFAYYNVIQAYDFYAQYGLYSVDGNGVPIIVNVGMEEDNATYSGVIRGWGSISFSPVNTFSQALDVIGHEYTHGIMRESMVSVYSYGVTGSLGEAYSDVMGNIIEMSLGYTDDTEWLIGEQSGSVLRSMSDPRKYGQPVSLIDNYYSDPEEDYDKGNVHVNCSIISCSAYKLYQAGMSYDDLAVLYLKSIELLNPKAGYLDIYESLIMSVDINGFDAKYKDVITEYFTNAGIFE